MREPDTRPLTQDLRRKLDRENAAALAGQVRETVRCPVCHTVCRNGVHFETHLANGCAEETL